MGSWTGTVPSFIAGQRAVASAFQTLADIATALTAARSTFATTATNLTAGTGGTSSMRYRRLGSGEVQGRYLFVYGSASAAVGSSPRVSLPADPHSSYASGGSATAGFAQVGRGILYDTSTGAYRKAIGLLNSNREMLIAYWDTATTLAAIGSTAPWTWAVGDIIQIDFQYEPA